MQVVRGPRPKSVFNGLERRRTANPSTTFARNDPTAGPLAPAPDRCPAPEMVVADAVADVQKLEAAIKVLGKDNVHAKGLQEALRSCTKKRSPKGAGWPFSRQRPPFPARSQSSGDAVATTNRLSWTVPQDKTGQWMGNGPPPAENIPPMPTNPQDLEGWLSERNCELWNAMVFGDVGLVALIGSLVAANLAGLIEDQAKRRCLGAGPASVAGRGIGHSDLTNSRYGLRGVRVGEVSHPGPQDHTPEDILSGPPDNREACDLKGSRGTEQIFGSNRCGAGSVQQSHATMSCPVVDVAVPAATAPRVPFLSGHGGPGALVVDMTEADSDEDEDCDCDGLSDSCSLRSTLMMRTENVIDALQQVWNHQIDPVHPD